MKKYIALITLATLAAFWFFNKGAEINEVKNIAKEQKQQIEYKNEIIKVKNFQQDLVRKTPCNNSADDRREFLQFIFEERKNTDR